MMQTFLLACYLCLQLTNLSEDLTKSAMIKRDTACDQCLTGLFDNSELLSRIGTQTDQPMASNVALIEALEERLMMELSRSSMKAKMQQREEELKREAMMGEQVKMAQSRSQEILTATESALKTMQQNMMQEMERMSMMMMKQLKRQQMQLTREQQMSAAKQQQPLMNEMTMTMKENTNEKPKVIAKDTLMTNVKLMADEPLVSENGRFKALLLRVGDLVIIDLNKLGRVVKEVGSMGQSLGPDAHLILEPEGNLAMRTGDNDVITWSTPRSSEGALYSHVLKLENDGQLVVYDALNRRVWTSGFV